MVQELDPQGRREKGQGQILFTFIILSLSLSFFLSLSLSLHISIYLDLPLPLSPSLSFRLANPDPSIIWQGFFAGLMKKPESKIHIEVTMDAAPAGSALPPNLVCSAVCLEALQQYCTTLSDFAEASKTKPFERLAASDVVLATFPLIMDDTALMTHFANAWSARSKKLGKKATKQQLNEAFRYVNRLTRPSISCQ
jgi:hypothetical protein